MPAKTRLAQLMAQQEGWGPAANLPTRDNNPLDLRHSPHSEHSPDTPDAIGKIDTIDDGWADAERQLQLWADRGDTLAQAIATEAPKGVDGNDTARYLAAIVAAFDGAVTADMPLAQVLQIPAV